MKLAVVVFTLTLFVNVLPASAEHPDAAALVRQSVVNYEHDWREGMKWTYRQNDVMGKDGSTVTEISEIGPLFGTPYERLIAKNGKLTSDLEKHEEEKYAKVTRERENESPEQREARIRKYDTDRAFFKEIPDAYEFRIVGEPSIGGRPAWQIAMTPRAGYQPKNSRAAMLRHIGGTLWIDKQDVRWAKAEAEVNDTISIGWVVARVGPGAKFGLEQMRVAPNLWLPKRIDVDATAKVMMLHNKDLTEHLTYSDYHETGHDLQPVTERRSGTPAAAHAYK